MIQRRCPKGPNGAFIAVGAGVLGAHISLHRDISSVRIAARETEGFEVLISAFVKPDARSSG